jgi:hypothetical protein
MNCVVLALLNTSPVHTPRLFFTLTYDLKSLTFHSVIAILFFKRKGYRPDRNFKRLFVQANQKTAWLIQWKQLTRIYLTIPPEVIEGQEFESEVSFSIWTSIDRKLAQSEMSFSIFCVFYVLMKLYCRLSIPTSQNLTSDFPSELPLVKNSTNQKRAFLFLAFPVFW